MVKFPLTWQDAQGTVRCAPVSGNGNVLAEWLKVELVKSVVLWHWVQSCGYPSAAWFGFVVPL